MALTVHALTTVSTIEGELGLGAGSATALLERLINGASEAIERFCGRHFEYEANISEKVAGYGGVRLVVSRTPVVSIASIAYNGSTISSSEYSIEDADAGLIYRSTGWKWTAIRRPDITQDRLPGTEQKLFTVTYTGGYVTPQQAADNPALTRSLPYDLEQACIDAVVTWYRDRGENRNITSEKVMSASLSYNRHALPEPVQEMLAPYRRIV